MLPPLEERKRWLVDPELRSFLGRLARKATGNDSIWEDVRQSTYLRAWSEILESAGPQEQSGMRPWMSRILRYQVFGWAKKKGIEIPFDPKLLPQMPAEDERALNERLVALEKGMDALDEVIIAQPELAKQVLGKEDRGRAATPGERQSKRRAFVALSYAVTAALGVAAMFMLVATGVVRGPSDNLVAAGRDGGAGVARVLDVADHTRKLAVEYCDLEMWGHCLSLLDGANRLDGLEDPTEASKAARARATAALEERRRQEKEAGKPEGGG